MGASCYPIETTLPTTTAVQTSRQVASLSALLELTLPPTSRSHCLRQMSYVPILFFTRFQYYFSFLAGKCHHFGCQKFKFKKHSQYFYFLGKIFHIFSFKLGASAYLIKLNQSYLCFFCTVGCSERSPFSPVLQRVVQFISGSTPLVMGDRRV